MNSFQLFGAIVLFSMFGLIIFCFIMFTILQKKRHFLCPECHSRFKPEAFKAFFSTRRGIEKMLTCPFCGYVGYMDNVTDSSADFEKTKEENFENTENKENLESQNEEGNHTIN